MNQLLEGVRVLDLSNVLAGPFCGYQLALFGADVIKVESPDGGDLARQLGADPALNAQHMGTSFLAQNANKRSMVIDLKSEQGRQAFLALVEASDVVLENFRPGVMERLGLGHEHLRDLKPSLVCCAISGFGQDGPLAKSPAYDQIIQGRSGVMSITGDSESSPLRVGYPVCDTLGGLMAAFAISSALVRRGQTGEGAFIDVSMLDTAIASMGWIVSNLLIAGQPPVPMGNENFTASPSGTFSTGNGLLNIAANKQEQFEMLCDAVGAPHLKTDERFAKREARKLHRQALREALESYLRSADAATWEARLNKVGVPSGQVLSVADALAQPQVAERGLVTVMPLEGSGRSSINLTASAVLIDGVRPVPKLPPPRLGEHTTQVLNELGISAVVTRV